MFSPDDYKQGRGLDYYSLSRSKPRLPIDYNHDAKSYLTSPTLTYTSQHSPQADQKAYTNESNVSPEMKSMGSLLFTSPSLPMTHTSRHSSPVKSVISSPSATTATINHIEPSLYQKIMSDQLKSSHNKAMEEQLREELHQQQLSYQLQLQDSERQEKLKQLEIEKAVERALSDNNQHWEDVVSEKSYIIQTLEHRIAENNLSHDKQLADAKNQIHHQLKEIEEKYDIKYFELDKKAKADCESYANSLRKDQHAYEYELANRYEAKEEALKDIYDKKLRKYEKQIIEAEESYRLRSSAFESQMKETREEFLKIRQSYELNDLSMKEELAIKDMRLTSTQRRLDELEDVSKAMKEWRTIATELGALCIRTCAKGSELPKVSSDILVPKYASPKSSRMTRGGWMMAADEVDAEIKEEFMMEYNMLRKRSLTIDRRSLIKLLKYSKRVIELSESPKSINAQSMKGSPSK